MCTTIHVFSYNQNNPETRHFTKKDAPKKIKSSTNEYLNDNYGDQYNIVIEEGITTIAKNAFRNCTGLVSIIIPQSVTTIEDFAFFGCIGLRNIDIPDNTALGTGVFSNCLNLSDIVKEDGNERILIHLGGDSHNIPPGITKIGNGALFERTDIQQITIPDTVTEIGDSAFEGCTNLISVVIPNNVTKIGMNAFKDCSYLNKIGQELGVIQEGVAIIPDRVTEVGDRAFENCNALKELTIDSHNVSIGWFAFSNCTNLIRVRMNGMIEIGDGAFFNCENLCSLTGIPQKANSRNQQKKKIGRYAFAGCDNLRNISIASDIDIQSGAFCRKNLKSKCFKNRIFKNKKDDMWHIGEQGFEDSFLNSMIDGIIKHEFSREVHDNEGNRWLEQFYRWRLTEYRNDEIFTTKKFYTISNGDDNTVGLIQAVRNATPNNNCSLNDLINDIDNSNMPEFIQNSQLKQCIEEILKWGGLSNFGNIPKSFTKAMILIRNDEYYMANINTPNTLNYLIEKGKNEKGKDRIAFWSKILAAYKPGDCFIYDSRVAITLSYISLYLNLPVIWRIPKSRESQYTKKAYRRFGLVDKDVHSTIGANRERYNLPNDGFDIPTCYSLYIKLLNGLAEKIIENRFNPFLDIQNAPLGEKIRECYLTHGFDEKQAIMAHLEKMFFMMKLDVLKKFDPSILAEELEDEEEDDDD